MICNNNRTDGGLMMNEEHLAYLIQSFGQDDNVGLVTIMVQ